MERSSFMTDKCLERERASQTCPSLSQSPNHGSLLQPMHPPVQNSGPRHRQKQPVRREAQISGVQASVLSAMPRNQRRPEVYRIRLLPPKRATTPNRNDSGWSATGATSILLQLPALAIQQQALKESLQGHRGLSRQPSSLVALRREGNATAAPVLAKCV